MQRLLSAACSLWCCCALYAQFDTALVLIERPDSSTIAILRSNAADTLWEQRYLDRVRTYHPDIRVAAAGIERARGAHLSAWGLLDPRIRAQYSTKNYYAGTKNTELSTTLQVPLYWGQQLTLGYRRATDFFDTDYTTSTDGEPSIGLMIPLIRNVQTDPTRTAIARTQQGVIAAEAALDERRNSLSLAALNEYYGWVAARARYDIAADLLAIIAERYRWIRSEIQRGERAPIDSVEVLQELFRRRSLLVRARNQVERSVLSVALYVWEGDVQLSINRYVPEPFPLPIFLDPIRVEFDRVRALQRRPEMRRLQAELEQLSFDVRLVRESFKPSLDAQVSLYSPQWSSDIHRMPRYWKAGINFELPLLYRAPIGQEQQVLAQQTQLYALIEFQRRRIENDVLLAAATVNATYEQVILARAERRSAEIMVEAERQLFERGESDLLRLNLRERLLAEAREREVDALYAHAIARALYRWAIADY
ncbi:MAG: TolC family protein [Chlorobi bacterium]|nr:TolC family protein [Chlorobiota bacterium]